MKAGGQEIVVRKKEKFKVEEHYDDCGDDLSSLGPVDQTMLIVGLSASTPTRSSSTKISTGG